MSKCPYCNTVLLSWSKFKDLKEKEGLGLAVCGFILNGLDHFMSGESRSQKQDSDYRTLNLCYCEQCKTYYLKCPHCNTYIYLKEMPNETRTLVTCSKCFKRVLYASNDYQLGGG